MKSLEFMAAFLAIGLAAEIGCGSNTTSHDDAAVLGSAGGTTSASTGGTGGAAGSVGIDAGVGGAVGGDASIATGGAGGALDGGAGGQVAFDGPVAALPDGPAGETGPVVDICSGLSATDCDLRIRNAAVDPTVTAQDVPVTNPPAYLVCSQ